LKNLRKQLEEAARSHSELKYLGEKVQGFLRKKIKDVSEMKANDQEKKDTLTEVIENVYFHYIDNHSREYTKGSLLRFATFIVCLLVGLLVCWFVGLFKSS